MDGLFNNLVLESFDFLLEGKQAEEYLRRKQDAIDSEKNDLDRRYRVKRYIDTSIEKNPRYKDIKDKQDRAKELKEKYPNAVPSGYGAKGKDVEEYEKAKSKRDEERYQASRAEDNYKVKNLRRIRDGEADDVQTKSAIVRDATRRHLRRHPDSVDSNSAKNDEIGLVNKYSKKNESFFEDIEFI